LSVSEHTGEPVIRIRFYGQSIINLVTFWVAMPAIVAGVFLSFKKFPSNIFSFLIAASSVCLGLSIFTQVTFGNSAKFTFILSFFYAIYFVYAISTIMHWMTRQWLKRLFLACIIFCLLTTPVITEAAYIISPWFSDETYAFSGRHIIFYQDRKRNEAYKWIRENTPPDALLMLTYVETSNPDTIAQNSTYEPSALAERNLFVVKDWYTVSNPEYKKRIMIRKKLFSDTSYTAVNKYFLELNRPVYLLVEDTQSPFIRPDSDFGSFDFNSRHFQLVFTDGRQRIYRIIPR
jgi:hypothetical protein